MKKTILTSVVAVSLMTAGCASTTVNPVAVSQPGDDQLSCEAISLEMQQMLDQILTTAGPGNAQVGGNVAFGTGGVFLMLPLFFSGMSNSQTVEQEAAQARFERLQQMSIDKNCSMTPAK